MKDRELQEWAERGLEKLRLVSRAVAPDRPRDGLIAYANGSTWNPSGTGAGIYWYGTGSWYRLATGAGIPLVDGDKGDVVVSATGLTWTIDNDAVTFAKMQNVATDRLLGRYSGGSGNVEEVAITDFASASSVAVADEVLIQQSGTHKAATVQQIHDALPIVYYTPASVTKNTGGTAVGNVAGVTSMLDGTTYVVPEVTGVPGFDIEFTWASVTRTPSEIVFRYWYEGSVSHDVHVELWNYNTSGWVQVHTVVDHEDYEIAVLPIPVFTNFISGGAVRVRLYHETSGNASHTMYFDYVALRAL